MNLTKLRKDYHGENKESVMGFAAACYDMNTIQELEKSLTTQADENDCKEWGITPEQWKIAVEAALGELKEELESEND